MFFRGDGRTRQNKSCPPHPPVFHTLRSFPTAFPRARAFVRALDEKWHCTRSFFLVFFQLCFFSWPPPLFVWPFCFQSPASIAFHLRCSTTNAIPFFSQTPHKMKTRLGASSFIALPIRFFFFPQHFFFSFARFCCYHSAKNETKKITHSNYRPAVGVVSFVSLSLSSITLPPPQIACLPCPHPPPTTRTRTLRARR